MSPEPSRATGSAPDVEPRRGGVLPVDKPEGPTSHDVVARARRLLDTGRIGHTGTLDPFASGLLLLCVDAATRLSEYLVGLDKTYRATLRLGSRTDTLDPRGEVVERDEAWKDLEAATLRGILDAFVGELEQVPPRFSAKKVGGERAYRKARRGETVELEPVRIRVHELELLGVDLPDVRLRVRCSSGTYVRALARDIGAEAGSSAHLTSLRRVRIGGFGIEDAVVLDDEAGSAALEEVLIAPARAISHLPVVEVDPGTAVRMAHGQAVDGPGDPGAEAEAPVAVVLGDVLVAVAERDGSRLRPRKVFVRV